MAHTESYYQELTLDPELIGGSVPGIARMPDGDMLAVWQSSQRVLGARSADAGSTWSRAQVLVDSADGDVALLAAERRVVLQYTSAESTQEHAGEAPRYATSGLYHMVSADSGRSWGAASRIDTGKRYCGNCNEGIALRDGTLIMPFYYVENLEGGEQVYEREMVCVAGVLRSTDGGATWQPGAGVRLPGDPNGADEPTVVELAGGDLLMLVRTTRGRHYQARSGDRGATWSAPVPSLLVASNTPAALYRLSFDPSAVVAVWTSTPYIGAMNRYPLSVAISYDEVRELGASPHPHQPRLPGLLSRRHPGRRRHHPGRLAAVAGQDVPLSPIREHKDAAEVRALYRGVAAGRRTAVGLPRLPPKPARGAPV